MNSKSKQQAENHHLEAIVQQLRSENARLRRESASPSLSLKDHPEASAALSSHLLQGRAPSVDLADVVNPGHLLVSGDELASLIALQETHRRSTDVVWVDMRVARSLHHAPQSSTPYPPLQSEDAVQLPDPATPSLQMLASLRRRLELSRRLMSQDGVLFLIVSDVELAHCKLVADSVFGPQNFIADMAWRSGSAKNSSSTLLSPVLEHVLVVAKERDRVSFASRPSASYRFSDEYEETRGKHALLSMDSSSLVYHKSLDYPLRAHDGTLVYAGGASRREWQARQKNPATRKDWCWRWPKDRLEEGMRKGFVTVHRDRRGDYRVRFKQYQRVTDTGRVVDRSSLPSTLIEGIPARNGIRETRGVLGPSVPAGRPLELFSHLLSLTARKDAVVLDVFSDGTSGHAVSLMNTADSGSRTVVMLADELTGRVKQRMEHADVPGDAVSVSVGFTEVAESPRRVVDALELLIAS